MSRCIVASFFFAASLIFAIMPLLAGRQHRTFQNRIAAL
jgi:hypothetical protein